MNARIEAVFNMGEGRMLAVSSPIQLQAVQHAVRLTQGFASSGDGVSAEYRILVPQGVTTLPTTEEDHIWLLVMCIQILEQILDKRASLIANSYPAEELRARLPW